VGGAVEGSSTNEWSDFEGPEDFGRIMDKFFGSIRAQRDWIAAEAIVVFSEIASVEFDDPYVRREAVVVARGKLVKVEDVNPAVASNPEGNYRDAEQQRDGDGGLEDPLAEARHYGDCTGLEEGEALPCGARLNKSGRTYGGAAGVSGRGFQISDLRISKRRNGMVAILGWGSFPRVRAPGGFGNWGGQCAWEW
jgi:hypothetical protein